MIYTIQGSVVKIASSMAAKIMSLYSITKEEVKSRRKIDGDLRLKMPRFSELEGNKLYITNIVSRHFKVPRQ